MEGLIDANAAVVELSRVNSNLRALLMLLLIGSLCGFGVTWATGLPSGTAMIGRVVTGLLAVGSLALLVWAEYRPDAAPDLLREQFPKCCERNGLCFMPDADSDEGNPVLRIYFQNRYDRHCEVVIQVGPIRKLVRMPPVPTVEVRLQCPGAAFGYTETVWAVPVDWQGKNILAGVAAEVRYPDGKGELLRFREGIMVGGIRAGFWDSGLMVAALATGGLHTVLGLTSKSRISLDLPEGVTAQPQSAGTTTCELLWPPDETTAT